MTRAEMEKKHPGLYGRLGTVPDTELSEEYGLSPSRLCLLRAEHGIPAVGRRRTPSEEEWVRLLALEGEITICADRRSMIVAGSHIRGRTLRQAVLVAVRGVGDED